MKGKRVLSLALALLLVSAAGFAGGKKEEKKDGAAPAAVKAEAALKTGGMDEWATPKAYEAATGKKLPAKYNEAPDLAKQAAAGKLPSVENRLPKEPFVVQPDQEIGVYGGTMNLPFTTWQRIRNHRKENLVGLNPKDGQTTVASVVKSYEVSADNKVLTFHLREGMKWSDGQPFTTEDLQFWYEDILLNKELTPTPGSIYFRDGEIGVLKAVDAYTFTWSFKKAYPLFAMYLGAYDGPRDTVLQPKHYLKRFHSKYANKADLDAAMKKGSYTVWTDLFNHELDWNNPNVPTLSPWMPTGWQTEAVQKWVRNPYYFRVDTAGNQLPYIDEVLSIKVSDTQTELLKTLAGDFDYNGVAPANFAVAMDSMKKGNFNMDHSATWMPNSYCNIMFNYTIADPAVAKLYNDVRFRQALSVAINREEINKVVFNGTMTPSQVAPAAGAPYNGDSDKFKVWTQYDPALANKMLDEIGLTARDAEGYRLGLDGKQLRPVIYANIGWPTETGDVMNLVAGNWQKVGIKAMVKTEAGQLWVARHNNNEHDISARASHFGGGPVHPSLNGNTFALGGVQWGPEWAKWMDTSGKQGSEPPADVKRLRELKELVLGEPSKAKQDEYINEAFSLHMKNLWTIGIVRDEPLRNQQRTVSNRLGNVMPVQFGEPDNGYFASFYIKQ